MFVLGVGGFMHDYNCTLIDVENQRIAMCEAERLSRKKHHVIRKGEDLLLPIRQVCKDLGCKPKNIDTVVFGHTDDFPCKEELKKFFKKAKIVEIDHHICHAAGAFYTSGVDSGLIVSLDGFGDGSSGLLASGNGTKIHEIERISEENSIGLEYLRATVHLGLGGIGAEGKTQGLASYGEPTLFEDYMNEIEILSTGNMKLSKRLQSDGSRLAEEGGYLNTQLLNNQFLNEYCQRRFSHEDLNTVHKNLASSIQKVLEHVVKELSIIGKKQTGEDVLLLSGGVSMNSSMNGVLMQSGLFKKVYPIPMSSDRGIAVGAALYHIHHNLGIPRFYKMDNLFLGNKYTNKEIKRAVKKAGLGFTEIENPIDTGAKLVSEGKIIAWFQDRSEMGARALGHRSIVADPRKAEMKDIINAKVKHREWFRPFAPSVLEEEAHRYFDYNDGVSDLTFMTFTVDTNKAGQEAVPAVVHRDNTSRIQTVRKKENKIYAELIERFGEITGVPCVLNTSFNDNGEPIVETPEDACRTFTKTGIDVLIMNNIIVEK